MDGVAYKGVPLGVEFAAEQLTAGTLGVRAGDLATPVATLCLPAVEANATAMQRFCAARGVQLAPHAKTTLAANLLDLQLRHGAWGLTAALPRQVALLWQLGFQRVLLANEVTDPAAIGWLAGELARDEQRTLLLYADSERGVELLADGAARAGDPQRPFDVLVELGHPGGRTGVRDVAQAAALARRIAATPGLRLAGVSGYEGTLGSTREPEVLAAVDAFLDDLRGLAAGLLDSGLLEAGAVVSAGGSVYFDRVCDRLADWAHGAGAAVVLRSGCYLIHDHGIYAAGTPASGGVADAPQLIPALSVWARVVSAPEPGLALLDAGRRDVSHDAGLPVPLTRVRDGESLDLQAAGASIGELSDQHAFLRHPGLDLRPGDLVRLGISHPCTTLDRHRALFLVDADDRVVGVSETRF